MFVCTIGFVLYPPATNWCKNEKTNLIPSSHLRKRIHAYYDDFSIIMYLSIFNLGQKNSILSHACVPLKVSSRG
jgi:hypothetical protein